MTPDSNIVSITKLRYAFQEVRIRMASLSPRDIDALRGRMCQVVYDQRDRGTPPERIVIVLQRIANEAGVTIAGNASLEGAVQSCIDEYFAEPTLSEGV